MANQSLSESFAKEKETKEIYVESVGADKVITNEKGLLRLLKLSKGNEPKIIASSREGLVKFKKAIA